MALGCSGLCWPLEVHAVEPCASRPVVLKNLDLEEAPYQRWVKSQHVAGHHVMVVFSRQASVAHRITGRGQLVKILCIPIRARLCSGRRDPHLPRAVRVLICNELERARRGHLGERHHHKDIVAHGIRITPLASAAGPPPVRFSGWVSRILVIENDVRASIALVIILNTCLDEFGIRDRHLRRRGLLSCYPRCRDHAAGASQGVPCCVLVWHGIQSELRDISFRIKSLVVRMRGLCIRICIRSPPRPGLKVPPTIYSETYVTQLTLDPVPNKDTAWDPLGCAGSVISTTGITTQQPTTSQMPISYAELVETSV